MTTEKQTVLTDDEVHSIAMTMKVTPWGTGSHWADALKFARALLASANQAKSATGDVWLQHDADLRYVRRVLDGGRSMTEEDRQAAIGIVDVLRTTARSRWGTHAAMSAAPFVTASPTWKHVPVEPTDEMLIAGQEAGVAESANRNAVEDCKEAGAVYRSMLNAAPPAPAPDEVDPMDWPLPCDVTVGHGTMRKGVRLGTLVARMKVLYEMATGQNADEVAGRTLAEREALGARFWQGTIE